MKKVTPPNITKLKKTEIFVFGSNADGIHAGGAAKTAVEKFGAMMGNGTGLQGQSYAIDTMSGIDIIKDQVATFLIYASQNPNQTFLVTELGCGIAGYTADQIARLFGTNIPENVHLPESFWAIINIEPTITTYKGFDKDLKCRGFQYEINKEYIHEGKVSACNSGFHACKNPFDIWNYYPLNSGTRYAIVEQSGDMSYENTDSKVASKKIKIKAEIGLPGLIKAGFEFIFNTTFDAVKNPTSGYNSHSATSGDNSHSATSGYNSHSATSGDNSNSATSGDNSNSATSGKYSHSATSGKYSNSATSGKYSHSATSGYNSHSATSGDNSHSATSGDNSNSATSGKYSHSATSGKYSNSATSGDNSHSIVSDSAIAAAIGYGSDAKGAIGCWLVAAEWEVNGLERKILCVKTTIVDGETIKADTAYTIKNGQWTEVK